MARTFVRQATQIRKSDTYTDNLPATEADLVTNAVTIEDDLNSLRSQVHNLLSVQGGHWYSDLVVPSYLDAGNKRGVNQLNDDLHELERKRVLIASDKYLTDVTVPAGQAFVVLDDPSLLPNNPTAAVGGGVTLGTVVAWAEPAFAAASLSKVNGGSVISPKNLCDIVDSETHDPILSGGRRIYALLQSESADDDSSITTTTPNRVQLTFVRLNALGNNLELVPVADIENKIIHYAAAERVALTDLTEQAFLRGAVTDVPAATIVTRQSAYENQGTTTVNVTTDSTLKLNANGLMWSIQAPDGNNILDIYGQQGTGSSEFAIRGKYFSGTSEINEFWNPLLIDSNHNWVRIGTNHEDNDLYPRIKAGSDGNLPLVIQSVNSTIAFLDQNKAGSSWTGEAGINFSDSSQEWEDFKNQFGEVSLLKSLTMSARDPKVYVTLTSNVTANENVGNNDDYMVTNTSAALPDMNQGSFLTSYDVYLNGQLLRPGADAAADFDYYPGSTGTLLKFEFDLFQGDQICVIPNV